MDQTLHLPTILVVHAMITLISTVVTIYMWLRYRGSGVLTLLMAAGLAACAAMLLQASRGNLPLTLSSGLGLALGILSVGIYWQAVVVFEGGRLSMRKASGGALAWCALWFTPMLQQSVEARTVVLSLIVAMYCFLTAREIWLRARVEPLPSRSIAAAANVIRGLLWVCAFALSLYVSPPYLVDGSPAPWFAYVALANSMMIVLSLVSLLVVAKERDEWHYRLASERDPLTNLANRRTFVTEANVMLSQADGTASLLLFDIDHFKVVNDTYGHAAGDQVLLAFSRVMDQRMAEGWLFARIGGEEFACLMPCVNGQQAVAIAENLRLAIADMKTPGVESLRVTVSIGVCESQAFGTSLDTLLASADAALYRAKADGRNCVCLYQPATLLDKTGLGLVVGEPAPHRALARVRRRSA